MPELDPAIAIELHWPCIVERLLMRRRTMKSSFCLHCMAQVLAEVQISRRIPRSQTRTRAKK
jgi:hypothetical protein